MLIYFFLSFEYPKQKKFFVLIKFIFIFRADNAECSHKSLDSEAQNLKIHPSFLNFKTSTTAADIKYLRINFAPSTRIFSGVGEIFINLKELSITRQSIKFVERYDFVGLTQLEGLYLYENQIEFLPEDVFWDLPNLEELWLQSNKIKKLPENIFKNLKKLKRIDMFGNKIEHFPENLFANNMEIEFISAYNNPLKTIDVDFTALKNLRWLGLSNANCIDFHAENATKVSEALRLINQNCTKTTQNEKSSTK
jgi:Leucine-rich repeat (LRR) protein